MDNGQWTMDNYGIFLRKMIEIIIGEGLDPPETHPMISLCRGGFYIRPLNSHLSSRQCLLTICYQPWQASSTVGGHSVTKVLQLQNF